MLIRYLNQRSRAAILAAQDIRNQRHAFPTWWARHLAHHAKFYQWLRVLRVGDRARRARFNGRT